METKLYEVVGIASGPRADYLLIRINDIDNGDQLVGLIKRTSGIRHGMLVHKTESDIPMEEIMDNFEIANQELITGLYKPFLMDSGILA